MDEKDSSAEGTSKGPTYVPQRMMRVVEPATLVAVAKELVSLLVTVDSVVATATLVVDDSHRRVSVRWGDGSADVIDLARLRPLSPQTSSGQPPNTLRIQHAYAPPFDTGSRLVTVVSQDNQGQSVSESAIIQIERRYRVNLYSVVLEFPHHLDSLFETTSEIHATMHASHEGARFFTRSWKGDVVTAPQIVTGEPITWLLKDSGFSRDISPADEPIKIWFDLMEGDGLGEEGGVLSAIWDVITSPKYLLKGLPISTNPALDDYDVPNQIKGLPFTLHPGTSLDSTTATAVFRLPWDSGVVFVRFHYELRLVVPFDVDREQVMATTPGPPT